MTVTRALDSWSLVIVGSWNPAILEPSWIGKHVLAVEELGEVDIQFQVGRGAGLYGFIRHGVDFVVESEKVVIRPRADGEDAIRLCGQALVNLLSALQHTPVRAVGLNVAYVLTDLTEKFSEELDLASSALLDVFSCGSVKAVSKYELLNVGAWPQVNVTVHHEPEQGDAKVELNFHYQRGDARLSDLASNLAGKYESAISFSEESMSRLVRSS